MPRAFQVYQIYFNISLGIPRVDPKDYAVLKFIGKVDFKRSMEILTFKKLRANPSIYSTKDQSIWLAN